MIFKESEEKQAFAYVGGSSGELEWAACVNAWITGGGSWVLPADIPMQFKI